MNYKKIALLVIGSLLLVAPCSALALKEYYARYEMMEKQVESNLAYDDSTANAIKHATAASDMYSLLRLAMNDDTAEEVVIRMGLMNEYIEQVIYPNDRDPAREIMKDLHNNYVGITAARLAKHADAFRIILSFANNRTLIVNKTYNPFFQEKEPKQDVVAFGYNWFTSHRSDIDKRVERKFLRIKDFQPSQIQVSSLRARSATIE